MFSRVMRVRREVEIRCVERADTLCVCVMCITHKSVTRVWGGGAAHVCVSDVDRRGAPSPRVVCVCLLSYNASTWVRTRASECVRGEMR